MNVRSFFMLTLGLWVGIISADEAPSPLTVETPPVPARLLSEAKREAEAASTTQTLRVTPGINEIIPVAQGHLNRIITPFDSPKVRTVSPATTQIEGHVLYVAPADENPVTLYVTPGDNEELALSLTLAPRRIPPREIQPDPGCRSVPQTRQLAECSRTAVGRIEPFLPRLRDGTQTDLPRPGADAHAPRVYPARAPAW
jgi:hypothetical protein